MPNVIYKKDDISIEIVKKATEGIIKLLTSMKWGTNGPIFQKLNDEENIIAVTNPHYIMLKKGEQVIGTCTLCERGVEIDGKEYKSYYLRHFAIDKSHQGQAYGKTLLKYVKHYFLTVLEEPFISFAAIEDGNARSLKVSQFIGYTPVGTVVTQTFSRLFPRQFSKAHIAIKEEYELIKTKLHEHYSDHAMVHFSKLFHTPEYYVWKEEGEIIAGVQAFRCAWNIESMPGFSGKIIMNVVPKIPIANRIFKPHYKFVAFGCIYCKPGSEDKLLKLMEDVLAKCGVNNSLLWLGNTTMYERLNKIDKWGLVHKIQGTVSVSIVLKLHGMSEEMNKKIKSYPMYLAAFDCI